MSAEAKRALIALPIVLVIGSLLALAGSQGSVSLAGLPLYALCIIVAFVLQWLAFIPAYLQQTERFYDLTGGLTYISVTLLALLASGAGDLRSWLLGILVIIWAARLSTFLFRRVHREGKDGRFDEIKTSFPRFLVAWTLQGLWVSFSLAAALAAITAADKVGFGIVGVVGLIVWLIGFGIEVVADEQKKAFRADPNNKGDFINTGLWRWSRHPNYFGEIVLWFGVAIIALPVLSGWSYVTLISPLFVIFLLLRVSGVPMLEARADEKWGGQADYEAYKAQTPVLVPRPPGSG